MTTPQDHAIASDADGFYLATGTIATLYHGARVADVIENVQRAAASGEHRLQSMVQKLATWREVFTEDFDDDTHFAMTLGDDVVWGKFENARRLRDGDQIAAVVARDGERLWAQAILRTGDDLLLIGGETAGPALALREYINSVARSNLLILPMFALPGGLAVLLGGVDDPAMFCWMLAGCYLVFMLFSSHLLWDVHRDSQRPRKRASAIYGLFGFPHPDYFNAQDGMTYFGEGGDTFRGMNRALALAKQSKPG